MKIDADERELLESVERGVCRAEEDTPPGGRFDFSGDLHAVRLVADAQDG